MGQRKRAFRTWGCLSLLAAVAAIGLVLGSSAAVFAAIRGNCNGRIAFDSARNGSRDIYVTAPPPQGAVVPAPSSTPTRETTGTDDERPSWSPPNTDGCTAVPATLPPMIAFQRMLNGQTNIFTINAANPESPTNPVHQVTAGGADTDPAWAPYPPRGEPTSSSTTYPPIAFDRSVNGHRDIFVANYDGTDLTDVTNSTGADYANPDWSSGTLGDALRLSFDSTQGGERGIWVMDIGYDTTANRFVGSNLHEVTVGQPASVQPSWFTFTPYVGNNGGPVNPIFDQIAFAGPDQDGGNSQIDVAADTAGRAANSTEPFADPNSIDFEALTSDACENTAPVWAPSVPLNGTTTGVPLIAYQKACAGGNSDIYVLDPTAADASGDINLTQGVGDNRNPDWEAVGVRAVEEFPIRPMGRRSRKRLPRAVDQGGGGGGGGGSTHTLTTSLSGPGAGSVSGSGISCPQTCVRTYPDMTMVALSAVAAPGSAFAGWTGGGCQGTGACTVSVSADIHLTATFILLPPALSALTVFPRTFSTTGRLVRGRCVAATGGDRNDRICARPIALRVSYRLTIPADLTITLEEKVMGTLINGRCAPVRGVHRTRHRCTRLILLRGSLTRTSPAGPGGFTFTGRIGGAAIKPGSYILTVIPSANGGFGSAQNTSFQILP